MDYIISNCVLHISSHKFTFSLIFLAYELPNFMRWKSIHDSIRARSVIKNNQMVILRALHVHQLLPFLC